MVRTAQQGLLTVSDHLGRVHAEARSWQSPEVQLVGEVSPGPGSTIYDRFGDWFGWTNLIALTLLAARLASRFGPDSALH